MPGRCRCGLNLAKQSPLFVQVAYSGQKKSDGRRCFFALSISLTNEQLVNGVLLMSTSYLP